MIQSSSDPSDLSLDPLRCTQPPGAVHHSYSVCPFALVLLNDQTSRSKLKVMCMIITSDVIFSLTCDYIPGSRRETSPPFCPTPPASSASTPQLNPENVNSSAANSTTVSAPLELIYHQFPFHHAKLFLEAEIGPIPASTTFHYGQELNTWRPTLSSPPPYQVKTSFFLFPGKKDFLFFTANCLRAVAAQSPLS